MSDVLSMLQVFVWREVDGKGKLSKFFVNWVYFVRGLFYGFWITYSQTRL